MSGTEAPTPLFCEAWVAVLRCLLRAGRAAFENMFEYKVAIFYWSFIKSIKKKHTRVVMKVSTFEAMRTKNVA